MKALSFRGFRVGVQVRGLRGLRGFWGLGLEFGALGLGMSGLSICFGLRVWVVAVIQQAS